MGTYDFQTEGGTSIEVSLPVLAASTTYDSIRAEFSATRNFTTISLTKNALASDAHNVMLALTASEIDTLKDCRFRVIGTVGAADTELWTGGIDYVPAEASAATVKPPIIRRIVHYFDTAPGRFAFDLPVTWKVPFPDSNYTVDCNLLDPTADTQDSITSVSSFVENGDGTGGTVTILPGAPDIAIGQHLEIWGYA